MQRFRAPIIVPWSLCWIDRISGSVLAAGSRRGAIRVPAECGAEAGLKQGV